MSDENLIVDVLDSQGHKIKEGVAYLFDFEGDTPEISVLIIQEVHGSGTVDGWALAHDRALNDAPPSQLFRPIAESWDAWPELKKAVIDYAGVNALDLT